MFHVLPQQGLVDFGPLSPHAGETLHIRVEVLLQFFSLREKDIRGLSGWSVELW